jgi:hypothetical protein
LEDGSKPEVVELPMPSPLYFDGVRLPASYANFYICNAAVIVPTFNDPNDRVALGILGELFKATGPLWAFTPWIWSGASARCTVSRSSSRHSDRRNRLDDGMNMAGMAGLEPVTSAVTGQRSNQLSYIPTKRGTGR